MINKMFDSYEQRVEKAEELAAHKTGTILYRIAPIFHGHFLQSELEKYVVSNIPCVVTGVYIEDDGKIEHYVRSCDTINIDNEAFTDVIIDNEIAGERNNHGHYYYFAEKSQAEAYCAELNLKTKKGMVINEYKS